MTRYLLPAMLFVLLGAPAVARQSPPPPPSGDGPPPEFRRQMEEARTAARSTAMAGLSGAHRDAVEAIVAHVKSGQLTDLRGAAQKIDAILTPQEEQTVLAARDKAFSAIRPPDVPPRDGPPPSDGPGGTPPDGAPPPDGASRDGGPPPGRFDGEGRRFGSGREAMRTDAGLALLTLSLDREQLRSLFMRE